MTRLHLEGFRLMEQYHGLPKTALGRMATKDKSALELIRTPEHMAELQDEETAVKKGYHLGKIR